MIAALFCVLHASYGQWNGSIDLDMGTNFKEGMSSRKYSNSSGHFTAWGSYRTDRFSARVDLQAIPEFAATSVTGQTVNVSDPTAPQLNYDMRQKENTTFIDTAKVQLEYRPDRQNTFSFNARQTLNRQDPSKVDISINNIISVSGKEFEGMKTRCSFDIEEENQTASGWNADAKWIHRFEKPGREIDLGLGWGRTRNDKASNWHIIPTTDVFASEKEPEQEITGNNCPEKEYRITPLYINYSLSASVRYRDADLFGQKNLHLEVGMDIKGGFDSDELSAANHKDNKWVDSLEYRESFNYFSVDMAPMAKLSYSPGKFNFNLRLTPDLFINRLNSDEITGSPKFNKVYVLPDLNFSVFVQGKDLFDRPIEVATYSMDRTYARIEETTYNRRTFSIGASFKF